jgi:hypothetical protein
MLANWRTILASSRRKPSTSAVAATMDGDG